MQDFSASSPPDGREESKVPTASYLHQANSAHQVLRLLARGRRKALPTNLPEGEASALL